MAIAVVCGEKKCRLSSVIPSILGLFTVGIFMLSTFTSIRRLYSLVKLVKRVAEDFVGCIVSCLAMKIWDRSAR